MVSRSTKRYIAMHSRSKDDEIQFYLDRSKESIVTVLRSVLGNPRLSDVEQFKILATIADHHRSIAATIDDRLRAGEETGLRLAEKALAGRSA